MGCSDSRSSHADKIGITVRLGPAAKISEKHSDDLLYQVTNKSSETISFCGGTVVFYDSSNRKVAESRIGTIWVNASDTLEEAFDQMDSEKATKFRPLAPGQTIQGGDPLWFLFNYDKDLLAELADAWEDLRAEAVITEMKMQ
jgi:hypothetical protein